MRSGTSGNTPGGMAGHGALRQGSGGRELMNLMRSGTAGNNPGGFSGNAAIWMGDRLMNLEEAFIPVSVAPEALGLMNL